ncbi:MAG: response regulator [Phenylobacterium sp.]|uniref:response regulator n=1 Tax=Phenylobacterium sp. TaxID=1871053 RepID=UPI00271A24CA|nr:response regulator [Phenylobacterium sp.]MDO9433560.1 response regulator [Phenylobacterium sp.]
MSSSSPHRVLIVDDNRHARAFLSQILQSAGLETEQAASGPEALRLLQTRTVDVVFTDMVMAPMDGIALTRAIRASVDRAVSGLPVIMATAQASQSVVQGGVTAGVNAFITKPFSPAAVLTRLEAALAPPARPAPAAAPDEDHAYI